MDWVTSNKQPTLLSSVSSVIVNQEVIVSDGDPGDTVTDTIARNARNKKLFMRNTDGCV